MKVAVSIPDAVFDRAEHFAKTSGQSRSAIYSAALHEYVSRHGADEVTDALDRVFGDLPSDEATDPFVTEAARRTLHGDE